jgi:hypothetical protein
MTITRFVLIIGFVLSACMLCVVLMAYGHLPNLVAAATSGSSGPMGLVPKWHVLICPTIALLLSILVTLLIEFWGEKIPDVQISRARRSRRLNWTVIALQAQLWLALISWSILHTAQHFLDAAKDEQQIFASSIFLLGIVLQSVWTALPEKPAEQATHTARQARNELLHNIGIICVAIGLIALQTFISEFASPAEILVLKPISILVFIALCIWIFRRIKWYRSS